MPRAERTSATVRVTEQTNRRREVHATLLLRFHMTGRRSRYFRLWWVGALCGVVLGLVFVHDEL